MSRKNRLISEMGIYHVMMRGVNCQQIFYDEEDNSRFQKTLERFKHVCGFRLYAYCLMGNHIHLLIQEGKEPLGLIIQRLGVSYVYWYNTKYDRVGHLFQGRYKSEAVNTSIYFKTVLRYILRNPVAAGICNSPEEYPYSSAGEYLLGQKGITDTTLVYERFGEEELKGFIMQDNDDKCLEMNGTSRRRKTDAEAKDIILKEFGAYSPSIAEVKNWQRFRESIRKLIKSGISIRQLSRLTGVSKKMIENALKEETGASSLSPGETENWPLSPPSSL